jgi:hypothetical protein
MGREPLLGDPDRSCGDGSKCQQRGEWRCKWHQLTLQTLSTRLASVLTHLGPQPSPLLKKPVDLPVEKELGEQPPLPILTRCPGTLGVDCVICNLPRFRISLASNFTNPVPPRSP